MKGTLRNDEGNKRPFVSVPWCWLFVVSVVFLSSLHLSSSSARVNSSGLLKNQAKLSPLPSFSYTNILKPNSSNSHNKHKQHRKLLSQHRNSYRKRRHPQDDYEDEFADLFSEEEDFFGGDSEVVPTTKLTTTTTTTTTTEESPSYKRTVRDVVSDDEDSIFGSGDVGSGDDYDDGERDDYDDTKNGHHRPTTPTPRTTTVPYAGGGGFVKRFYRVTITIQKKWTSVLESTSSSLFKVYEDELNQELMSSTRHNVMSLQVLQFINIREKDYVRVKFDIGIEESGESLSRNEIEKEFLDYFQVGLIGNLRVKRDSGFSVQDIGAPLEPGCAELELQCRNGHCVPVSFRCDGNQDCGDGTDEENCPTTTTSSTTTERTTTTTTTVSPPVVLPVLPMPQLPSCRSDDQVRCFDGQVVICGDQVCDGMPDCPEGEDEDQRMKCNMTGLCPMGHFECDLDKCLPSTMKCNGVTNCADGTDEVGCPYGQLCLPFEWACKGSGHCILLDLVCDGYMDCPLLDKSASASPDEEPALCSSTNLTNNIQYFTGPKTVTATTSCLEDQFKCGTGLCIPSKQKCDGVRQCNDGSDERNCPIRPICLGTEFICEADGFCIPLSARCNQRADCSDGSDEKNCPPPRTCPPNMYKCLGITGQCLNIDQRCDRKVDCLNGDDEQGCSFPTDPPPPGGSCNREQFRCFDGSCIDKSLICDNYPDCSDGSDEGSLTCPAGSGAPKKCPSYQFQCESDGSCIHKALACDGFKDCADGSDEDRVFAQCGQASSGSCASWQFHCSIDNSCIDGENRCNGRYDCYDGADERNCTSNCKIGQFKCSSGGCIAGSKRCDYIPDCRDNSDEENCSDGACGVEDVLCDTGPGGPSLCIPSSRKCDGVNDCPSGQDELNCGGIIRPQPTSPPATCRFGEFQCVREGNCIPANLRCQGRPDCSDGSDEERCTSCSGDNMLCGNGRCLSNAYRCNGLNECGDGTDEERCGPSGCSPEQFQCINGQCITLQYKCDGYKDCADGSDEDQTLCRILSCGADQFTCNSGQCVPKSAVCDQRFDCSDTSDELNCPVACGPNEFKCVSDGACISPERRCNNRPDCYDGSDEQNCPPAPTQCRPGEFSCRTGNQCVGRSSVCNGVMDCNDFSDEADCGQPEGLNLKTYPTDQSIKQGNEVVFQCRDEGLLRAAVRWVRGNGLPLPPGSRDSNGRLEIPSIAVEHSGTYVCEAVGYPASSPGARVSVYLRVDPYEPPPTPPPTACAFNEATCNNGQCIPKSMVCNGYRDCDDGSDEMRCRGSGICEPNEFQCENNRCIPKTWRCDGDDDCGDSTDENSCSPPPPGSPCRYNEFQCTSGNQCIPKAFHCDKQADCPDRSDESGCSPPSIVTPPPPLVTLDVGDIFNISCRVSGIPPPEIVWRRNWGHIPEKCSSFSGGAGGGIGVLTCPNMQIDEQGAYSCEAMNILGSTFAIPDCTLIIRKGVSACRDGSFNALATRESECLTCFCFGQTTTCDSVNLYISQLPPPTGTFHLVGASQDLISGVVEVQESRGRTLGPSVRTLGPSVFQASLPNLRAGFSSDLVPYFALPASHLGDQSKSYGGYFKYNVRFRSGGSRFSAPDVILRGNGLTILHVTRTPLTGQESTVAVRLWEGEWFKRVYGAGGGVVEGREPASRGEIMMVLANVQSFLIRAQYDSGSILDTTISNIVLDTATSTNYGLGQAISVEECRCPPGYLGLSCQECAPGFTRVAEGPYLGRCTKTEPTCPEGTYQDLGQCRPCPCPSTSGGRNYARGCYKDTDGQPTCQCHSGHIGRDCSLCAPGYEPNPNFPYECRPAGAKCDLEGSLSGSPDPLTGRCRCKDNVMGPTCDQCKASSFHLSTQNQYGCISCFCMGITNQCTSSNWYRSQESANFYSNASIGGFTLVDLNQRISIPSNELYVDTGSGGSLAYSDFSLQPTNTYYWNLPPQFTGDKVSSYGGYLNYSVRYIPPHGGQSSPNNAADVELNGNQIRLLYFRKDAPFLQPNREERVSVPFLEQYWQRQDGQGATREHLLMALSGLESLLIKATYTTNSREAFLRDLTMDIGISSNTGQERAVAVEQCSCPVGYQGLSCQECSYGYTRSLKGLYLGLCEPCRISCNGHSDECDSKLGICRSCRGFTTGDFCDECQDGYTGNPKTGDCIPGGSPPDRLCSCDPKGSARMDCPDRRNCICKGNTEGPRCDLCKIGTFAMDEQNPLGCSSCYCSGVSQECAEGRFYKLPINLDVGQSHGLVLTDSYRTMSIREITFDSRTGELSHIYGSGRTDRLFWSLPSKFTGNRVTSYGGQLKATRRYFLRGGAGEEARDDMDVILVGKNGLSLFYFGQSQEQGQRIIPGQRFTLNADLKESNWRHVQTSGRPASRTDLMSILADIEAILIRASFSPDSMESTHISEISLDSGVRQYTQFGTAHNIEECKCPQGFSGSSCETCSPGYYYDRSSRSCNRCPCEAEQSEGCVWDEGRRRVSCNCRPGFTGEYCGTRDRVIVELSPVKVSGQRDSEQFACSVTSSLRLQIQFATDPPWNELVAQSARAAPRSRSGAEQSGALPQNWGNILETRIPILPGLKRVICRITTDEGDVVAEVFSTINGNGNGNGNDYENYYGPVEPPILPPIHGQDIELSISEPRVSIGELGGSVSFRCSARSLTGKELRIIWTKELGVPIPTGRARDDGQGLLVITDLRPEDEGSYICQATDGWAINSDEARLSLGGGSIGPPSPILPIYTPPEIRIDPPYLQLSVGQRAEFRCTATGRPTPTVSWSGGRGGGATFPPHVRVSNGVLTIEQVRKSDEAEYHCRAENSHGSESLRTILYVQGEDPVDGGGSNFVEPERERGSVSITPSQLDARAGESVRFYCDSTTGGSVSWYKQGGGALPRDSSQSGGQFVIYGAREEDSGTYVCSDGSNQAQARLNVAGVGGGYFPDGGGGGPSDGLPPTARAQPERQTIAQGDPFEINCITGGFPPPTVQWSKAGGDPLPLSAGSSVNSNVLRIPSATVSDRGVYVCNVESPVGKSLASAIVEVERREPPQLEIYPSATQTALKDSSAIFQCRLLGGIPVPTLKWARADGRPIPRNIEEIPGGVLRFSRITGEERGAYVCTAENVAGTTSATAHLEVQFPPTLTLTPSSPYRVRVGEKVRLECRGEGEPLPTVSWAKLRPGQLDGLRLPLLAETVDSGRAIPNVGIYEISRATKGDEGTYSCSGRNEAGLEEARIQLLVDEVAGPITPYQSPREETYYFPIGSRAELRCQQPQIGLFEQLYLDWERTDGGLMPRDYLSQDGVLYINDVRLEDSGTYACTGINQQGQNVFSTNARLEVVGSSPPFIRIEPTRQIVRRGDTVQVQCLAEGQGPMSIRWERADRIPISRHPNIVVNNGNLTFQSIEVTDAGRYACIASNPGGTTESVAEVIVNVGGSGGGSTSPNQGGSGPSLAKPSRSIITADTGSPLELECSLPGPGIIWSFNNHQSIPRNAFVFGNKMTLMGISDAVNSGIYSCESGSRGGIEEFELRVISPRDSGNELVSETAEESDEEDSVRGEVLPPDRASASTLHPIDSPHPDSPLNVQISSTRDLVRVGEEIELHCSVESSERVIPFSPQQIYYRWHKVGGSIGPNVNLYENLLKIRSVRPENGGVYRCVAHTPSGTYESSHAITIQASPPDVQLINSEQLKLETKSVPLGSTVRMDCSPNLDPPIAYTWNKEDELLPQGAVVEGSTLTLVNLEPEDSGIYVCTGTNQYSSVDVPTILTVTGVVPSFSQNPISYIALPTLPTIVDSYLSFDLRVSFKADHPTGLILYNAQKKDGEGDFFSFGLVNGFPQFRFDLGSGVAFIPATKPVPLGAWTSVRLKRTHGQGSMTVNNEDTYSGSAVGKQTGLNLNENLFVGGVQDWSTMHRMSGFNKGFVGCISELWLNEKKQSLLPKDSVTRRGVSTCDTCSKHSCRNGGICQEGLSSKGYKCICTPGYSGDDCSVSGVSCTAGVCGSGRCVNTPDGYDCYCKFGTTGVHCERDVVIHEPSFNGKSYLTYPKPKALARLQMSLRLKPESTEDGLIMYSGQTHLGNGDFTSISIKDQKLEFQYDNGNGPASIRSKRSIRSGEWIDVSIKREAQDGELVISSISGEGSSRGRDTVKGKSQGTARSLNLNTQLYIGGWDPQSIKLNSYVNVSQGFKGCLKKLVVSDIEVSLIDSILEGANVENCVSLTPCARSPCLNNGLCTSNSSTDYYCDCRSGYVGENCEIRDSCSSSPCANGGICHNLGEGFKCACTSNWTGQVCNEPVQYSTSVSFRGEGYLELDSEIDGDGDEVVSAGSQGSNIELSLQTHKHYGLIYYHGRTVTDLDGDFEVIGLQSYGRVNYRRVVQGVETINLTSRESIDDGGNHTIVVDIEQKSLRVDNGPPNLAPRSTTHHSHPSAQFMPIGNPYLGGLPDASGMTDRTYVDGFTGCVHSYKKFGPSQDPLLVPPIDLKKHTINAVNIGPCDNLQPSARRTSPNTTSSIEKSESTVTVGNRTIHTTRTKNRTVSIYYSYEDYYPDEEDDGWTPHHGGYPSSSSSTTSRTTTSTTLHYPDEDDYVDDAEEDYYGYNNHNTA